MFEYLNISIFIFCCQLVKLPENDSFNAWIFSGFSSYYDIEEALQVNTVCWKCNQSININSYNFLMYQIHWMVGLSLMISSQVLWLGLPDSMQIETGHMIHLLVTEMRFKM